MCIYGIDLNIFMTSIGHESRLGKNLRKKDIGNNVAMSVATLPMGTSLYSF